MSIYENKVRLLQKSCLCSVICLGLLFRPLFSLFFENLNLKNWFQCWIWLRLRVIHVLEMLPTKGKIQIALNNTNLVLFHPF